MSDNKINEVGLKLSMNALQVKQMIKQATRKDETKEQN